jgi:hypothetical protein
VERAIVLASNLPGDLSVQLSEALMREIAQRSTSTETGIVLAVRTLRNMAAVRPLETASVRAMLEVAKEVRNYAPALDSVSRDIADLTQLDRLTVFAALQNSSEPAEAWLERFMRIAEPKDLPFLDEVMGRCQIIARHRAVEPQLRRIVRIAGVIKGSQAQALLQDWYVKYPTERRTIALALALRPDLDRGLLEKMFGQTGQDVNGMFYALASAQPNATQQVAAYLSGVEADDKFTATLAVKLFGQPEHTPWLWQNIGYSSAKYYPNDVTLRQLTLSALLHVGLNRRSTVTVQPQAAPAKALSKARVEQDAAPQLPDATILEPAREELPAPAP